MTPARPPNTPEGLGAGFPSSVEALADALAERVAAKLTERVADEDPWLDVDEAAEHLRCARQRIYDLVSEGRLRCAKDGRRSLFRRSWLDACLTDSEAAE